jgi:predicted nucleic acid-binding protein
MILVDTSVWIDHFRSGLDALTNALESDAVMTHPFVVGELACGHLHNRTEVLRLLDELPQAPVGNELEVRAFIERHRLMGRGIGYIDVHLLAAATLAVEGVLWTRDKRLASAAAELHVGANE